MKSDYVFWTLLATGKVALAVGVAAIAILDLAAAGALMIKGWMVFHMGVDTTMNPEDWAVAVFMVIATAGLGLVGRRSARP